MIATAMWRRDKNQEWAEETLRSTDVDPIVWFRSLQRLLKAIKRSQLRIYEENSDEENSQSDYGPSDYEPSSETSDMESSHESEGEESWEDARES